MVTMMKQTLFTCKVMITVWFYDIMHYYRDCLRFAFMKVLQSELNDIRRMWNTHFIRKSRQHSVAGIPNELFQIPHMQGKSWSMHFCCLTHM